MPTFNIPMMANFWDFEGNISEFVFWINKGLHWILYYIEKAFYWLAGTSDVSLNGVDANVIPSLMRSEGMWQLLIFFSITAIAILAIAVLVAIIRGLSGSDSHSTLKKVISKTLMGGLLIFMLPLIAFLLINALSMLITMLVGAIGQTIGGGSDSLADSLFMSMFTDGGDKIRDARLDIVSSGYGDFAALYNMNIFSGGCDFNYFVSIIISAIFLFCMVLATIRLAERLISVLMLYVLAPFTLATYPLDDGARFKTWRELTISKMITVIGNVLGMYLFLYLIIQFTPLLQVPGNTGDGAFAKMIFYIVLIGGAFATVKGTNIVANLISQQAAQEEANSFAQSHGLLSSGLKLAGAIGGAAAGAAMSGMLGGGGNSAQRRGKNGKPEPGSGGGGFNGDKSGSNSGNSSRRSLGGAIGGAIADGGRSGSYRGGAMGAIIGGVAGGLGALANIGGGALMRKIGAGITGRNNYAKQSKRGERQKEKDTKNKFMDKKRSTIAADRNKQNRKIRADNKANRKTPGYQKQKLLSTSNRSINREAKAAWNKKQTTVDNRKENLKKAREAKANKGKK